MIVLEDVLRETFEARAQRSPALDDPAGVAIRRARRTLRRRRAGSTLAAVVAAMALSGTLVLAQDWRAGMLYGSGPGIGVMNAPGSPAGEPSATPAPGRRPGVDLFAKGQVWTVDGGHRAVAEPGWEVVRAFRVPTGWLLGGRTEAVLVDPNGASVVLPLGRQWTVSADGSRVAYTADGTLRVATLGREGLREVGSAQMAAGTAPVGFAGERVVVGVFDGTGKLAKVDNWQPGQPYRPTWSQRATRVYEVPGDDLLAQVPPPSGGPACLTRLAVAADGGLRGDASAACGIEPAGDSWPAAVISPDGHWLAMPGPSKVDLYDLGTVFSRPVVTASCVAPATAGLVWESSSAVLATDGVEVVRCALDGATERARLPADLPPGWRFVPSRPAPTGR